MPAWDEILEEVNSSRLTIDGIRRNYLKQLSDYTGRNVILYYSNFLGQLRPLMQLWILESMTLIKQDL